MPRVTPIEFNILISLLLSEQHGLAVIQEISERTEQEIFLSPGTLYNALKRMHKTGWIEQSEEAPPAKDGNAERRRYYRLSEPGYEVLIEEVERMERVAAATRVLLKRIDSAGYSPAYGATKTEKHDTERDHGKGNSHSLTIGFKPALPRRRKLAVTTD